MMNVLRADMLKFKKSMALKVIFLISGAGAVLMVIVARLFRDGTLGMNAAGNASFLADPQMVALLGTVAAGMFLCGDFENKTVQDAVSGGIGRSQLVLGKAFSFFFDYFSIDSSVLRCYGRVIFYRQPVSAVYPVCVSHVDLQRIGNCTHTVFCT